MGEIIMNVCCDSDDKLPPQTATVEHLEARMAQEPSHPVANSHGFVTFAKCFCINPVFGGGYYKKRKGWVLIDLATRAETYFKTLRDAKHHLIRLYMEAVPKTIAIQGC
jgi:hypothetical protein